MKLVIDNNRFNCPKNDINCHKECFSSLQLGNIQTMYRAISRILSVRYSRHKIIDKIMTVSVIRYEIKYGKN